MAITPTVMIAASGLLNGQGVGPSAVNTSMSNAVSDPLGSSLAQLKAYIDNPASNPTIVANVAPVYNSMNSSLVTFGNTYASTTTQAAKMAPDVKTFISMYSSSASFGSASAEYGSALSQFGTKNFSDLGVGVNGFTSMNSGGLTSLSPELGKLSGTELTNSLGHISTGLNNYGTLLDFSNPQSLGYQGMVKTLQDQGLADSLGINDQINSAGYNPHNLKAVPDSVLQGILSGVQGNDLQRIISITGVKPVNTVTNASQLVDPNYIMPAGAISALGLSGIGGVAGIKGLGNNLTNIGVPLDNASAAKLLGSVQTNTGSYLSALSSPVPASVNTNLSSFLGSGTSPFGTPSMKEMMGTLSGKNNNDFASASKQFNSIATTSAEGQSLTASLVAVLADVQANVDPTTTGSLSSLSTASSNFDTAVSSSTGLQSALGSVNSSMTNVTNHLALENTNLGLAGLDLNNPPTPPIGSASVLSFASKLHSFGVDKQGLGHNDIFNGATTDDLTGDAIRASLAEGKNVAAMQLAGKTPPQVSVTG